MSRSYRHSCIRGHGGHSEKQDKRTYNRRLRTRARQMLHQGGDFDAIVLPEVRDVSNPWSMNKDGKSYSRWLARYAHSLAAVTRVRDGRERSFLFITDRTVEIAEADNRQRSFRWAFARQDIETDILDEVNRALEGIRK